MSGSEPMLSTYFHSKGIRLGLPVSGTFELTRRCNFNCKMCYVHTTDTSRDVELTTAQWLEIAEQAKARGMLFLLLTGGEPFVRKDFGELYSALSEMGFMISINSNASLINEKHLALFEEKPPCRMNISIYGGSDETYKTLCGSCSYQRVKDNIRSLKEIGVGVSVNALFNKFNRDDIEAIYDTSRELGAAVRASAYIYPDIRVEGDFGCNAARLTCEEAAECTLLSKKLSFGEDALRRRAEDFLRLGSTECESKEESLGMGVQCRAGRSSFWITYDGRMLPCGMMTEPWVNMMETGFDGAWEQIKKKTAEIRLPVQCSSCKNKEVCNVCAAMCYAETGSFSKKPEYICGMVEHLAKEYIRQYGEDGKACGD